MDSINYTSLTRRRQRRGHMDVVLAFVSLVVFAVAFGLAVDFQYRIAAALMLTATGLALAAMLWGRGRRG